MKRILVIFFLLTTAIFSVNSQTIRCCRVVVGPAPPDPDATAFLAATGITDPTITTAIDDIVPYAKDNGFYTDYLHFPMVGGTSVTQAYNISLTSAYYLVWHGSWTHDANGAQAAGGSGDYAETNIIPSTFFPSQDNTSITYYCNNVQTGLGVEIGVEEVGTPVNHVLRIAIDAGGHNDYAAANNGFSNPSSGLTTSKICYTVSRISSTEFKSYINGVLVATTSIASNSLCLTQLYLSASNIGGPTQFNSNKRCAYLLIGPGVDDAKALAIYNGLQAFETTLSRNN